MKNRPFELLAKPVLAAALLLSACGESSPTTAPPARPPAAATVPAAAPTTPAAPAAPLPDLMLESGTGATFATTGDIYQQLPDTTPPNPPQDKADSPALAQARNVRRTGEQLVLQPTTGPAVTLTSVTDAPENTVGYYYWGELPTAHQWVVYCLFWEGSGTLLVDQRTGAKKYVWGTPAVSPDGHHICTASGDLGAEYNPNGVQLYRVGPDSLTLLGERKITTVEPWQARWLNPHAVVLQLSSADFRADAKPKKTYLGLELARRP